jgi:hypothetical protein
VEPLAGAHSQLNRVAQQLNERSPETLGFETRAERDLMLVLHRPIEPTVISGHFAESDRCPLYPRKQTFPPSFGMSAACQKRTNRPNVRFGPESGQNVRDVP